MTQTPQPPAKPERFIQGVREAIKKQGASLLYLPPYSPAEAANYSRHCGYAQSGR